MSLLNSKKDADIMYRSYKFRIYLNDTQRELINKSFGCSRFVYNYYLSLIRSNGYRDA